MLSHQRAFEPFSGAATTLNIAVSGTSQSVTIRSGGVRNSMVRLTNIGTQTVFVSFGATAVTTTSTPLLANSTEVFSVPQDVTTVHAIAAGTGSTLYVTQGQGV